MFTGIIADVGRVRSLTRRPKGARIEAETAIDLTEVQLGDSIAVNGVCLTAVDFGRRTFTADVSQETLQRTTLGALKPNASVNLELALRVGDRLGGHIVQGHVDGVGKLAARERVGDGWDMTFDVPVELMASVVEKGSIAIDGISLTVAKLGHSNVTIAVVPHTGGRTTLADLGLGSPVNVETDVIGKYVLRALGRTPAGGGEGLSEQRLKELGFV